MSLCTIQLVGNVGKDAELRQTPNGTPVVGFSVAVNQSRPDPKSETGWSDETDWFRITAWGALAERLAKSIRKGDRVAVAGTFRTRQWTDDDNAVRLSLDVNAQSVTNFGKAAPGPNGATPADDLTPAPAADDLPF